MVTVILLLTVMGLTVVMLWTGVVLVGVCGDNRAVVDSSGVDSSHAIEWCC